MHRLSFCCALMIDRSTWPFYFSLFEEPPSVCQKVFGVCGQVNSQLRADYASLGAVRNGKGRRDLAL